MRRLLVLFCLCHLPAVRATDAWLSEEFVEPCVSNDGAIEHQPLISSSSETLEHRWLSKTIHSCGKTHGKLPSVFRSLPQERGSLKTSIYRSDLNLEFRMKLESRENKLWEGQRGTTVLIAKRALGLRVRYKIYVPGSDVPIAILYKRRMGAQRFFLRVNLPEFLKQGIWGDHSSDVNELAAIFIKHGLTEPGVIKANFKTLRDDSAEIQDLATYNEKPKWNRKVQAYTLQFLDQRVKVASVKNFILEDSTSGTPVLQFGRGGEVDRFILDFHHPLSPVQAFAVAISMLHKF